MVKKSANVAQRARYEKPELKRVRLDVNANTLAVNCWNSTNTDPNTDNGCNLATPTCAEA